MMPWCLWQSYWCHDTKCCIQHVKVLLLTCVACNWCLSLLLTCVARNWCLSGAAVNVRRAQLGFVSHTSCSVDVCAGICARPRVRWTDTTVLRARAHVGAMTCQMCVRARACACARVDQWMDTVVLCACACRCVMTWRVRMHVRVRVRARTCRWMDGHRCPARARMQV